MPMHCPQIIYSPMQVLVALPLLVGYHAREHPLSSTLQATFGETMELIIAAIYGILRGFCGLYPDELPIYVACMLSIITEVALKLSSDHYLIRVRVRFTVRVRVGLAAFHVL